VIVNIAFGIALLAAGLAVASYGIKAFLMVLPLVGFIVGFSMGASAVAYVWNEGFLATATSWAAGIALGVILALLSYAWWYFGALIAAAGAGALLGTAIAGIFGISSGWLLFLLATATALVVTAAAWAVNLPVYMVIINTAIVGAAMTIAGALMAVNQLDYHDFRNGFTYAMSDKSWLWAVTWIVLAALGISRQLKLVDSVKLPGDRWARAANSGHA
jgi:hypothetical protein